MLETAGVLLLLLLLFVFEKISCFADEPDVRYPMIPNFANGLVLLKAQKRKIDLRFCTTTVAVVWRGI